VKGRCACGSVSVSVARKPDYINFCNCGLCRRTGGGWGYFAADEVSVEGEVRDFQRLDIEEVCLTTQFCPTCGSAVRWVPLPAFDEGRVGVNMRLFEPADIEGVETRFPDGIGWTGNPRHTPLPYGSGTTF
jgi:hypothetical protein